MKDTKLLIQKTLEVTKPSKDVARNLIRRLYCDHPNEIDTLARLYKFFAPAAPRVVKTNFQWVAQVAEPKNPWEYCRYVMVRGGQAFATNHHRAHFAQVDDMDDGYYTKAGDLAFPISDMDGGPRAQYILSYEQLTDREVHIGEVVENSYLAGYEIDTFHFQKKYVDEAINYLDNPKLYFSQNQNLFVKAGDNYAIILKFIL